MIPAYARLAHRRLRLKLAEMQEWNETSPLNSVVQGAGLLGLITSGISFMHAREAAPDATILKLGFTYPLPMRKLGQFVQSVRRCVVLEEGDPYLVEALRGAGLEVEGKADMYRFGELDVARVRRILNHDLSPEPSQPPPANRPNSARPANTASSSTPCASRIASSPGTSAATRSGA